MFKQVIWCSSCRQKDHQVNPNVTVNSVSIEVGGLDQLRTRRSKAHRRAPTSEDTTTTTIISFNVDNQIIVRRERVAIEG
jgi:hypothetical protein